MPPPPVDWSKVDNETSVGPAVLGRFNEEGFRFSAKVQMEARMALADPRPAPPGDSSSESE